MTTLWQTLPFLVILPATISAFTFDCSAIRVDKQSFDLHELGGPKSVHWQTSNPPSISNTTFTIDICAQLPYDKNAEGEPQCSSGTRVCGVERIYSGGNSLVGAVIDIAGQYTHHDGAQLDPELTRLKGSDSHSDAEQEGLRVVLNGGKYPHERTGQKQKAIIEFICDKNLTGNEGFEADERSLDTNKFGAMNKREDGEGDGEDDGDEEEPELPDLDAGKSLEFVSYKLDNDDVHVLRLSWKTKYACEDAVHDPPTSGKKGGWGFFTWFLIIAFLLAATYIIFGSWLNYNRYGARGWDLIPHGDAIRDFPYVVKDWISDLMHRFRGSGSSRGGYSAV